MSDLDLAPFLWTVRKMRIGLGIFSPFALLAGVGVIAVATGGTMSHGLGPVAEVGLGGFLLLFGVYSAFLASRSSLKDRGVRALVERPEDIVWIYPVFVTRNAMHVSTRFVLKLANGKETKVEVGRRDEARAEQLLTTHCSRARFGFNHDWEKQYRADPASLAR